MKSIFEKILDHLSETNVEEIDCTTKEGYEKIMAVLDEAEENIITKMLLELFDLSISDIRDMVTEIYENHCECDEECDCDDDCGCGDECDCDDDYDEIDEYYDELDEEDQQLVNAVVNDFINLKEVDLPEELSPENKKFLQDLLKEFAAFTLIG